ncbi:Exo70 exocyst complex subunit protein [Rutstroemia sp. NJR-2017a BVV2]|nr:Exo70 exocyst complex subunit protein [Rutstroemia sp. NJR-2017a BVV2]
MGRSAWSLASSKMAVGLGSRQADEEARAEVDVLKSRLEKTSQLTKKIQASLGRLDATGKGVQEAIGPIYGNTQKLQILGQRFAHLQALLTALADIDGMIAAIDRIRQPSDIKSNEEDIIRKGPEQAGLSAFLSSVKRVNKALADMKRTNLRSNQQAMVELSKLSKSGNTQLESHFQNLLQEDSQPLEPLHYITKNQPFPLLSQDKTTRLGLITNYIGSVVRQSGFVQESPVMQSYASVRGPFLKTTLQNLASASMNTAKKKTPDAIYRQGTNGIGTYAMGMEGAFLAEYDNICALFTRDEWGKVFNLTCQSAIAELTRTLRELNIHIKSNLPTDCYLAYEIIEIVSNLSSNIESRTGELKPSFAAALKPIRETGKSSLAELLEDTRKKINLLPTLPQDASAVPITTETMTRLQTMVDFLRPISSIMISIGDGGWKSTDATRGSTDQIPSLNSFDVNADGKQIFAHYCIDTVETLLTSLEQKAKPMLKGGKSALGVFIANNAVIVDRMIDSSDLRPLLASRITDIEKWVKTGATLYASAWREPSGYLLDVQYTNRGNQRPPSQSGNTIDSAAIVKALTSKDKDAIKEKFRSFNTSFEDLVARHKSLYMEKEVRELLARQVQQLIEPLYGRFWDRYHEVDKGKGKYVKYDKVSISAVFGALA